MNTLLGNAVPLALHLWLSFESWVRADPLGATARLLIALLAIYLMRVLYLCLYPPIPSEHEVMGVYLRHRR